jgi:hypothetical protein
MSRSGARSCGGSPDRIAKRTFSAITAAMPGRTSARVRVPIALPHLASRRAGRSRSIFPIYARYAISHADKKNTARERAGTGYDAGRANPPSRGGGRHSHSVARHACFAAEDDRSEVTEGKMTRQEATGPQLGTNWPRLWLPLAPVWGETALTTRNLSGHWIGGRLPQKP